MFLIDQSHSKGHTSCSKATFLTNYMGPTAELEEVNSAAAECGNKGLKRIRKTVSYSNEANAIIMIATFFAIWNRRRLLQVSICFIKVSVGLIEGSL